MIIIKLFGLSFIIRKLLDLLLLTNDLFLIYLFNDLKHEWQTISPISTIRRTTYLGHKKGMLCLKTCISLLALHGTVSIQQAKNKQIIIIIILFVCSAIGS